MNCTCPGTHYEWCINYSEAQETVARWYKRVYNRNMKFIKQAVTKEKAKEQGLRIAKDALEALDATIDRELEKAGARAKANGRKTIQPQDMPEPPKAE